MAKAGSHRHWQRQIAGQGLLLVVAMASACSKSAPKLGESSPVQHDEGTLIYWNSALEMHPDELDGRFAATVTGLRSVEIFGLNDGLLQALVAPAEASTACDRSAPFNLAWIDIDGDSMEDLVVLDPCGSWVALQRESGFEPQPIDSYIRGFQTGYFVNVVRAPSTVLVTGTDSWLRWYGRDRTGWIEPRETPLPAPHLGLQVTTLMMTRSPQMSGDVLVQSRRHFLRMDSAGPNGTIPQPSDVLPVVRDPYLVAFDGFDQLFDASAAGCGPVAVGVGLFAGPQGAHDASWTRITFDDGKYAADEIDTSFALAGYAVANREDDSLILALGKRGGVTVMSLWRLTECGHAIEKLSEAPATFDWRTPEQKIVGATHPVLKTNGYNLRARWLRDEKELVVLHYDGFSLHVFHARDEDGLWQLVEDIRVIHDQRDDLAFVD